MTGRSYTDSLKIRYRVPMGAYMMVHPTNRGDEVFAHCDVCGQFEPLGINLEAEDEVAEEFLESWQDRHECGDIDTTGLLLYADDEQIARAFGL